MSSDDEQNRPGNSVAGLSNLQMCALNDYMSNMLNASLYQIHQRLDEIQASKSPSRARARRDRPRRNTRVLLSIVGDVAGIQVDMLDFIGLRVLSRKPVERGCEVEFSSADFRRSAWEDCTGPCRYGLDLFRQGIHEFNLFFRPLFIGGEHLFELLECRGVSSCIGRGDIRCWSVERNREWFSHGSREIALKSRRECMDSCRIDVLGMLGRYAATGRVRAWSLRSDRALARARSLRSNRAMCVLGRYVATELWLELGRYSMDQTDQNASDVPIEVHPSDQIRQTNRAVYRLDPRTINLARVNSDSDHGLSLLARLARTSCTDDRAYDLSTLFDLIMDFSFGYFSKARILKLSEDLGFVGTQLVRSERPAALADRPAYVLILTALDLAGSDASGQKPNANISQTRWSCESYQATVRDSSLGGLVSHIKNHLKSGISKAIPQPSGDPSIHLVLHSEFISKSDPFETLSENLLCDHPNSERNTCVGDDQTLERIRQTNRAVYRLDPRTSGLELRPNSRPDDRTDRTEARPSRPTRQAKTDGQARINLARVNSDSDHGFSLLARLARIACTDDRSDDLSTLFDTIMDFSFGYFSKARILKLSEDLGFVGTQLVRSERPAALADRPAYVLILTALDLAGSDASGQKPNGHFD
ncbi:hypothetical protein DY000_02046414 [Brassica cretica]|uniref:Uncharacterized protein n=1 Tax=Brassica cretica TaxID=69181 RepID=A0ABQ7F2A1_BRACR|nr:hypothetical protein DY000_02046414 [Brassica cretica]